MKVCFLGMTSYDGPAPGFEVWPAAPSYCDPAIATTSTERWLGLCEHAEALGFDWISVSEHHYAPYMMTPNPAVLAGALTQRIKRAKIALLGPLVAINNPVRIAEELAMLDVMSGGRIVALFLRGTPNEHLTYGTPSERTRALTQEGIDLILKVWQSREPFSWQGENFQFGTVSVWPHVVQSPHPPSYASGNSDESIRFAASRRLGIAFSFAPVDVVRHWVASYRAEAERLGWTPTPEHVIYRGIAYVADSDAQANADAEAHFGVRIAASAKLQQETMGGPPLNDLIIGKPFFLGGPETVLSAFETLRDCGVGVVDMVFGIGSHDQQVKAMETFAQRVLPTIKGWDQSRFA